MQAELSYKTLSLIEICNGVGAFLEGLISLEILQVYLGCFELLAVREATKHSKAKKKRVGIEHTLFHEKELIRLLGASEKKVKSALKKLHRLGLLTFKETSITAASTSLPFSERLLERVGEKRSTSRPIPIPRAFLRFLLREKRASVVLTALSYILRGLSLSPKARSLKNRGTVKATWIAMALNLSERSVRYARKELKIMGWLSEDTTEKQWKKNRDGAFFEINLLWGRKEKGEPKKAPDFAPLPPKKKAHFAPPYRDNKTYYVSRNQKTSSGVSTKQEGGGEPDIRNIRQEDLESFSRTETLYRQAVEKKWVKDSESTFQNWVAAACKAKRIQAGDRVKIFVGIVKKGLWNYIAQEDEERARAALNRYKASAKPYQPSQEINQLLKSLLATV